MLLANCHLLLVSCGFHLRGAGKVELSPVLSSLRVNVEGNQLQNDPLLVVMKNVLRTQADVQIEDRYAEGAVEGFGEKKTLPTNERIHALAADLLSDLRAALENAAP